MKSTSKILVFIFTFLALTASAYAQSPREQLQQMVEQLQKSPGDNALRERIIRFGAEIKPAPAIPQDAIRSSVRGDVFQTEAKDASGIELAISAYRDALRIAPWWGDAYFNLAGALGSAGKFDEAIASLKLSIVSVPAGSAEAQQAQKRIYAIEAKSEMASRQAAAAAQQAEKANSPQAREATLLHSVDGARFVYAGSGYDEILEIRGQTLQFTVRIYSLPPGATMFGQTRPGEYLVDRVTYREGAFTRKVFQFSNVYTIRSDGQALVYKSSGGAGYEISRQ
jgi:tetratricopeptide (TPR) repeat protein